MVLPTKKAIVATGVLLIGAFIAVRLGCRTAPDGFGAPWPYGKVRLVSIIALVARPEMYDGQHVKTMGWVRLGFEKNGLFSQRSDEEEGLLINGLGLQVDRAESERGKLAGALDKSYCIVEGEFSAVDKGHMGMYSGSITNVCFITRAR